MRQGVAYTLARGVRLLHERTILGLMLLFCLGMGGMLWYVERQQSHLIASIALQDAALYAQALTEFRTLCRILKGDDETRLIPIVIMTALGALEDRVRGIEAGADDFLTKPVHERELLARVQTALKLKHTVDRKIGELRRIKEHFAKFVPEEVKRLIAANPEAPALSKDERDIA